MVQVKNNFINEMVNAIFAILPSDKQHPIVGFLVNYLMWRPTACSVANLYKHLDWLETEYENELL